MASLIIPIKHLKKYCQDFSNSFRKLKRKEHFPTHYKRAVLSIYKRQAKILQVKDIAITRKGCSFLRKYFDFENENDLIKIKQCILQNLTEIITDQYGNYVIQSILTKEGSLIIKDFINEICKNIVFFSNNKFSSNAVEKCFENESMKNIILDQIIQKDIFEKIILDKFGNYVVQKAIAKADEKRRNYMLQLLIPLIPSLKSQYFGQRLLSKLIMQYPNININL